MNTIQIRHLPATVYRPARFMILTPQHIRKVYSYDRCADIAQAHLFSPYRAALSLFLADPANSKLPPHTQWIEGTSPNHQVFVCLPKPKL